MNEVLKVPDVASELGIAAWTVRQLLKRGDLAGVRTSASRNATWLIPRASVDAYLGVRPRTSGHARALRSEDV